MAQSVKHQTLGFGSGHDLTGHEIEPQIGLSTDSAVEPAWDSLSLLSLSPPSLAYVLSLSLSLKINIYTLKKKNDCIL